MTIGSCRGSRPQIQPRPKSRANVMTITLSSADLAMFAFTAINSVRVIAYVPQILRVVRDTGGAAAISCTTWVMFALSHLSAVAYAMLTVSDTRMAMVFAANFVASTLILGLTIYKRGHAQHRPTAVTAGSRTGLHTGLNVGLSV